MKSLLLLLLALPITASAPVPTPAIAKFCVNQVVPKKALEAAINQAYFEGCQDVQTVRVDNYHYLVFGVKVLIGEAR